MSDPIVVPIKLGIVSSWANPAVDKSFLRKTAGVVGASASAPSVLADMITINRPAGVTRGGIYMKNTFTRTVGAGTWSASMGTKSVLHGFAAPKLDLLAMNPISNLGSNTGSLIIHQANATNASGTAALQQHIVGPGGVSDGYVYGGMLMFSHDINSEMLDAIGAVAFTIILEPNAAPAASETYTITTDLYEVWA